MDDEDVYLKAKQLYEKLIDTVRELGVTIIVEDDLISAFQKQEA